MNVFDRIVIVCSKIFMLFIRVFRLGSGATWPGEFVLRFRPAILKAFASQDGKIILVAGTNGKTTTAKMIDTILRYAGMRVRRNESGANLDNGIVSAFVHDSDWFGNLRSRYSIFEVDEATLPKLLEELSPHMIVLLNLFRDQLDRYGEVDAIAEKWMNALVNMNSRFVCIINGDDPQLAFIGKRLIHHDVRFFGIDDSELFLPSAEHAMDASYCPECGNKLTFGGVYFSHLGKWACGRCGFIHPELSLTAKDVVSPLEGTYNIYNTLAASLTGLALGISREHIAKALSSFSPAFGRMEQITFHRRRVTILLSKNPTGLNESLRTVLRSSKKGPIVFLLNDRIADGRDVSWIWDADMEMVSDVDIPVIVSGDRRCDMAVRLKYAGVSSSRIHVFDLTDEAMKYAISRTTVDDHIWVLPTYTAMLGVRKYLLGRKIL